MKGIMSLKYNEFFGGTGKKRLSKKKDKTKSEHREIDIMRLK
jgi:hypothetical protein